MNLQMSIIGVVLSLNQDDSTGLKQHPSTAEDESLRELGG